MKILWNIHLYPPHHNCGSELVAHHVNKYLVSKGHQVRVILQRYDGPVFTYEGVEVFPAVATLDAFRWCDAMMTHLDFTQDSMIRAMMAEKPLVHFIHNDIPYQCISNGIRGQYIVYNSDWIARSIGYKWPSITLHPPCDINYYNTGEQDRQYITLISLNERKGGYLFAKIAAAMPDRKFIGVVGSYDNPGPMQLDQGKILEMMPSNVTIMPNSPDILSVYKQTRLLLMPSDYESWGRTATEAMCSGIPVICTPTPGLKENVGDAGYFVGAPIQNPTPGEACVKTGRVEDWVQAIKYFDNPNYYRKYSLLCKHRAAQLDPVKELEALEKFLLNARF